MSNRCIRFAAGALFAGMLATSSGAQDLVTGQRTEPSMDPHFLWLTTNVLYNNHIYGSLVTLTDDAKFVPGLALSWKPIQPTVWEFKLRPGVKFHDGSDFTADDVVFTIKRVPNVPNNPNPYTSQVRSIIDVKIIDPLTVHLITDKPNPLLPGELTTIAIVSKKAVENATAADFTSGKAAIGAGPYKFESYVPGDRLVVTRNENYYGTKPHWKKVTFRVMANDAVRVAALRGGDVQVIDFLPPADAIALEKDPNVKVYKGPSDRTIYLVPEVGHEPNTYITDKQGKPLPKNPLRDLRVRQAISKAIDRPAIVARVMGGMAEPASQVVVPAFLGHNKALQVEKYDLEGAKKLLAEAGYPNGFGLTVHCPNDRYVNDGQICQAVGQMLARIGLDMKVDASPRSVFFTRTNPGKRDFALGLVGWGGASAPEATSLQTLMHTLDRASGMGNLNMGGYSNPDLDRPVDEAISIMDPAKRGEALQKAMALAVKELALIPLHYQVTIVGARKGIVAVPRYDEGFVAMSVRPEN
jgi:peptide/nickel transport system substrate-binding protein